MKRRIKTAVITLAFAFVLLMSISAATPREMYENGEVSDGNITYGDARDGIVSDVSEGGEIVPGEGTGLMSEIEDLIDAPEPSLTTANAENTTNTTNTAGAPANEDGGMGFGIIIAVLVITAVVIVIFLLLPKRRR